MSPTTDINPKTQPATKGADYRTESENQTAHGLACDEDTIDMIHHHNEREGKKERGSVPKTEPEPDYDVEGSVPHN